MCLICDHGRAPIFLQNSEDQNADRNVDSKDWAREVSDGNKDSWELGQGPFVLLSGKELVYIFSTP
jgi:hypothetical protein